MKAALKKLYNKLESISPHFYYLIAYSKAARKVRHTYSGSAKSTEREGLFDDFLKRCAGKDKCLQIGVKDRIGKKFGPNWTSVDKYDTRDFIDYHDDIHQLSFADESFDAIVCWSILEHVPDPQTAIAELRRVLKPGGEIWVQLPFLYPYHEAPKDYWRVTPDGLRVWMNDFKEISCGCDYWRRTSLVAATFYLGAK